jgi:hypothetical protein
MEPLSWFLTISAVGVLAILSILGRRSGSAVQSHWERIQPEAEMLAALNRSIHQFLVSTQERFRLKLDHLGRCFGLAGRFAIQSNARRGE